MSGSRSVTPPSRPSTIPTAANLIKQGDDFGLKAVHPRRRRTRLVDAREPMIIDAHRARDSRFVVDAISRRPGRRHDRHPGPPRRPHWSVSTRPTVGDDPVKTTRHPLRRLGTIARLHAVVTKAAEVTDAHLVASTFDRYLTAESREVERRRHPSGPRAHRSHLRGRPAARQHRRDHTEGATAPTRYSPSCRTRSTSATSYRDPADALFGDTLGNRRRRSWTQDDVAVAGSAGIGQADIASSAPAVPTFRSRAPPARYGVVTLGPEAPRDPRPPQGKCISRWASHHPARLETDPRFDAGVVVNLILDDRRSHHLRPRRCAPTVALSRWRSTLPISTTRWPSAPTASR